MNIAFASNNGENINEHFGWSKSFYLYEVHKDHSQLIACIDSSEEPEEEKEKLTYKIGTIKDADIMYCTQIGPTASKMIQSSGIHPVRVADEEKISDAITKVQEMLHENKPLWLVRIYHKAQARSA